MGFVPPENAYKLIFQDADMAGLEVTARGLNTGQFLDFQAAQLARAAGGDKAKGATEWMLQMLADAMVSWNVETKHGERVPTTMDGLRTLELDFNMAIIDAWMDALKGVPAPLSPTSSDGRPSLEASIPMDVPSPSLAS